ncbi:unnamed protein product [Haemonchus placei]|uniref:Uncharacterized protein n=1 Tax=Haemonchus placei TaxID=6290 RepID=A0A0N4WJM4_HAEPC|nr:unnamed protein product [Haemonchus placei]
MFHKQFFGTTASSYILQECRNAELLEEVIWHAVLPNTECSSSATGH